MLKVNIKNTENGFIITDYSMVSRNPEPEDTNEPDIFVIEDVSSDRKKVYKKLLMKVAELMGMEEDRFGNENLKISFNREGRKYCSGSEKS